MIDVTTSKGWARTPNEVVRRTYRGRDIGWRRGRIPGPAAMDGGQEAFFEPTWPWFRLTDMKPTNERSRLLC